MSSLDLLLICLEAFQSSQRLGTHVRLPPVQKTILSLHKRVDASQTLAENFLRFAPKKRHLEAYTSKVKCPIHTFEFVMACQYLARVRSQHKKLQNIQCRVLKCKHLI